MTDPCGVAEQEHRTLEDRRVGDHRLAASIRRKEGQLRTVMAGAERKHDADGSVGERGERRIGDPDVVLKLRADRCEHPRIAWIVETGYRFGVGLPDPERATYRWCAGSD
jgi:hypothetical protein